MSSVALFTLGSLRMSHSHRSCEEMNTISKQYHHFATRWKHLYHYIAQNIEERRETNLQADLETRFGIEI